MNESHKFVPAGRQAGQREQGAARPQRPYRRPQAHDLGRLERVQGGTLGATGRPVGATGISAPERCEPAPLGAGVTP
jgi:hypothetical protein